MGTPPGIDANGVTSWLTAHIDDIAPPLTFELIAGGHSNLTFDVSDSTGRHWVLRRPPLGQVLQSAHDMEREHTIVSALAPSNVPVAPVIGLETDATINGAPFYVMDFVSGRVVRDTDDAKQLSEAQRMRASESLVETLVNIHCVDLNKTGLTSLGKHDGYIERQLTRWYRQYKGSKEQSKTIDFHYVDSVYQKLSASIPIQQSISIVHGDYRLDNTMLDEQGNVIAVMDWEICTLGDPLADLGLLWVYWTDPGTTPVLPHPAPTSLAGFMCKDDLIARYGERVGRKVDNIEFYIAFGYWKLTCIMSGVYARYEGGVMGDTTPTELTGFKELVETLAEHAHAACELV